MDKYEFNVRDRSLDAAKASYNAYLSLISADGPQWEALLNEERVDRGKWYEPAAVESLAFAAGKIREFLTGIWSDDVITAALIAQGLIPDRERAADATDGWIPVTERWPEKGQRVLFIVDLPGNWYHGQVYGGTYTGDPGSDYGTLVNEFSTPGWGVSASHWMPSPEPPLPAPPPTQQDGTTTHTVSFSMDGFRRQMAAAYNDLVDELHSHIEAGSVNVPVMWLQNHMDNLRGYIASFHCVFMENVEHFSNLGNEADKILQFNPDPEESKEGGQNG